MLEHRRHSIRRGRVYMRQRDVQRGTALHAQLESAQLESAVRECGYSRLFDGWSVSSLTVGDAGFKYGMYGRSLGVTQKVRSQ